MMVIKFVITSMNRQKIKMSNYNAFDYKEIEMTTFDFGDGNGPVPARQHPYGGGWVADTAYVDIAAYIGPDARVSGNAQVFGNARVFGYAQVFDNARVNGYARVSGDALVFDGARLN